MATTRTIEETSSNYTVVSEILQIMDNITRTLANVTADNQTNTRAWNLPFSIAMATILSISSFLSIVGNLMVITVVIRHRGMRTRTNLFLVNLAVADFCVGALAVPFAIITLIKGYWVLGDVLCQIDGFINIFFLVASIHTLMYISIHKYYSITRPFSDSIQLNKVILMMAATWIWAGLMATITISGLNYVYHKPGTSQCGPSYPHDVRGYIHHAITQVSCIFIPLAIMIFCYVRMFKEIRAHSLRLQENSTLEKDVVLSQQKKVAITLFIVLACFVMCWIPYHIYASYVSYMKDKAHFSEFVNPLAYMLGYMNSAFNPIIYAFRSPSFREGYKEILCQTPTYVVTDDTFIDGTPFLSRRMPSVFSSPMRRSQSVPDTAFRKLSTASTASSTVLDNRLKFKHQKSLTELMRSAAKFGKGNSVIESNGSVIIMKGGKIVSVRNENKLSPKSPLFKHRQDLIPNGRSKNPQKINCKIELAPLIHNDNYVTCYKTGNRQSYESDDLFDEASKQSSISDDLERVTTDLSSASFQCGSQVLDAHSTNAVNNEETNPREDVMRTISPTVEIQCCDHNLGPKQDGGSSSQNKAECGIIINIDEDEHVLGVMPLTPSTKHKIARSDLFLFKEEPRALVKKSSAQSAESVLKPSYKRLPSVEHLDVPKSMPRSRSASDTNVKHKYSPLSFRRCTFIKIEKGKSSENVKIPSTEQLQNSSSEVL